MGEVLSMRKEQLKKVSGSRARGIPNAIIFTFNRTPSDEELQFLDDVMARAALMALTTTKTSEIEPRQPAQQHAAREDKQAKSGDAHHLDPQQTKIDASCNHGGEESSGLSCATPSTIGGDT